MLCSNIFFSSLVKVGIKEYGITCLLIWSAGKKCETISGLVSSVKFLLSWFLLSTGFFEMFDSSCFVQVNLFQKPSFLHHLTHNMTRDCSLNPPKNTSSEHVVYKFCFECQNKKQFLNTTCPKLVFLGGNLFILWVNWCKNEGFWKRFTCTGV